MSAKQYRIQALARLEAIRNYLRTLGDQYTESDYQVDDFLRVWGKLPPRPSDRKPYEGLFTLPDKNMAGTVVLAVTYFSQRDNSRDAHRTCFSSSCAMLLKYLRPSSISGDDEYINKVFQIGDTTRADVQVQAMQMFGLKTRFRTDADYGDISKILAKEIPVPIGFLHYGTDDAPTGGGHWAVVVGETPQDWIVHDPWGDLYSDYTNHNGEFVRYRKESFRKRFMPNGDKSGWLIEAIESSQRRISDKGIALIKEFEGFQANAYLCPAGAWTIGWGHTTGVKAGDRVTVEQAEWFLRQDLRQFEDAVNQLVTVTLTQGQFDALVSFAFNVGVGAFQTSTLLRVLNQDKYQEAADQFLRWNRAGDQVLEGLTRRRQAERKLFLDG